MTKKIVFMTARKNLVSMFWNRDCGEKCRKYGFEVVLPSKHADLVNPDWGSMIADCDALVTTWGSPVCTREFLKQAPCVQIIGHCAGSVAAVVDETTFDTDIQVTTANPIMAKAVAEWSLMATLMGLRNLGAYAHLRKQELPYWPAQTQMRDIRRAVIGIWGFGDISRQLLKMLVPLTPGRVLVCSGHASKEELAQYGAEPATLEELLKTSDVFHCLVGVNKENFQRLKAAEFAMLKDGATFVNGGRSRLLLESDLIEVLKTGRINAVLDVFDQEPLDPKSPFVAMENVILTPHNAGFPGRDLYFPFLLDEFDRFFRGEKMQSGISKARFFTMTNERMGR